MMQKKGKWQTPKLVVLVRENGQETVLASCKGDGTAASNTSDQASCMAQSGGVCYSCTTLAGS